MNKHRPTTGACVSRQVQVLALWRYNAIPPIQVQVQVQPSTVRTLTWLAGLATTHTSHTIWVGFTCPWLVVSWWSYILPGFPPVRFPFLPKHKQQHQRNIKIRIRVSCHSPDHRASSAQASHTIAIFVPATCIASPPYIRLLNRLVRSEAHTNKTDIAAARDISQASLSRDNLAVVAARGVPATVTRSQQPLPTPPNSISPNLPPHGLKAQLQKAKLEPIDSDLDLHEPSDRRRSISPALEASGAITGSLLAKYHLPEILLSHGPLAIRHIMGYLTTSVPGFSGIPPTKARRLVVGALEGRGGEGGGLDGEVEFEKVGWGRWDARKRGEPSRHRQGTPPSSYGAGIPITKNGGRGQGRYRQSTASSNGDSVQFSHEDHEIYMMEHEADKMSMDGSGSASCSEAPDDDVVMNDDPEDATDDEDWATMGAAALRAESYPNPAAAQVEQGFRSSSAYTPGALRSFSASSGMARTPQTFNIDLSTAFAGPSGAQEREAVEALLQLGAV